MRLSKAEGPATACTVNEPLEIERFGRRLDGKYTSSASWMQRASSIETRNPATVAEIKPAWLPLGAAAVAVIRTIGGAA